MMIINILGILALVALALVINYFCMVFSVAVIISLNPNSRDFRVDDSELYVIFFFFWWLLLPIFAFAGTLAFLEPKTERLINRIKNTLDGWWHNA